MRAVAVGLMVVIGLGACANDDQRDAGHGRTDQPGASAPGAAVGPGLSVAEALDSSADEPFLVNGFVVDAGGGVRLCTDLTADEPPDCVGPSLTVEELDVASLADLRTDAGTRWTPRPVQLLGTLTGETLRVAETARA